METINITKKYEIKGRGTIVVSTGVYHLLKKDKTITVIDSNNKTYTCKIKEFTYFKYSFKEPQREKDIAICVDVI